jgi:membrane protein DedA with SNARE-associated domain
MFDWITGLVEQTGYLGVAFLMLAENVFPPIPSELVMPLAGFTAAQGKLNIAGFVLAGMAGSIAGALLWYYVGRWVGCERLERWADRHGRWLTIAPEEVDDAMRWFRRHGGKAVLVGRVIPAVRTLISVPAGIFGMNLPAFLAYTAVGTAAWTALLAGAGYLLGDRYQQVSAYLNPVSNAIVAVIVLWYLYRVVTFRRRRAAH